MFMCWNVNFKAALSLNFLVASESGSRVDHVPWKTLDQKISCYNVPAKYLNITAQTL